MNKRKIFSIILQVPLVLTFIASVFAAYYAYYKNLGGVTFATPIIQTVILVLYLIGIFLMRDKKVTTNI